MLDAGLLYEADPRHAELLAKSMGLDDCKKVATPGVKKAFLKMSWIFRWSMNAMVLLL